MTRVLRFLLVMAVGSFVTAIGFGQNSNSGDIRGTVTDSSGSVIPGANVTVVNNDTGVITKYATNNDGLYDTNSILPGNYTVTFSKTGFTSFKRGPIPLQVGIVTVDAVLKVGAANEVIEVNASEAPLLKTEDAEVSTTLSTVELDTLPNSNPSNGYTELLKLLPGATGVTSGALLRGVTYTSDGAVTESLVMRSRSGTVRRISAEHTFEKLGRFTGREYR